MAASTPNHGTRARYRAGCRCDECRLWKSNDNAKHRPAKTPPPEPTPPPKRTRRARPQADEGPHFDVPARRRAEFADPLAQLIEDALWDERGNPWAANVAADRIREAGWRLWVDGPIEAAARDALTEPADAAARMRHELIFRGARSLDDPDNARYFASTVEAMRKVLADLVGPDAGGGNADIVEAIRNAGRDRDSSEVDDTA